jgi:hypothetical protein
MRSRRKIVPFSQVSHQGVPGSSFIIHEVAEPLVKPSSQFRATRIHVPATLSDYHEEDELPRDVVYVRSIPVKSRTKVVHVISSPTNSPIKTIPEEPRTVSFHDDEMHPPDEAVKVENERVFITTPLRKVENERVFIRSPVGQAVNERVFISSPEPKVALERVYIAQPKTPPPAQNTGSTPPSDFAGAAKDDALTTSGKQALAADGSQGTTMDDNNINGDFQ